jgi:CBS domain-containing protein
MDEGETMRVIDIMTRNPACCTTDTKLQEVAILMVKHDCGETPVVDSKDTMKLVGVITDRDITIRTVAEGKNPLQMTAGDCMSTPCVTVTPEMSVEECCKVMEENKVRRVPVVDENGKCCGIVAQADIAQHATNQETAVVVKGVSQPPGVASSHVARS